ncbi:BON domain-containing protein [Niveibacterium sp. 24ML]|uniref:BON domain-containing protein n=1 Tax=Niveibacterium sp. 24ML TaxID=2985512 RepID=UPI00226EAD8D|nr:BON domain-containing protein [Niveibacterium sp. 24ML]MCX9155818.1 BON domain-containing protein [Niveibacterium sp. 24ML]
MHYAKPIATLMATSAIALGLTTVLQAAETAANDATISAPSAKDAQLRDQVSAALKADPGLAESRIAVDAAAGVVTLRGELRDEASVSRAMALVASLDGVKRVENGLEVSAGK